MLKHSVRGTSLIYYVERSKRSSLPNFKFKGRDHYVMAYWNRVSGAKCRITLKIHISVTDKKKLSDLQKSIATGPFYVHSKFDMLSSLVSGEMWNLNPLG